jgi:Meiotically up-regulated gene 113
MLQSKLNRRDWKNHHPETQSCPLLIPMRARILSEIQSWASAHDGRSPGVRAFERATGISEGAWRGVYWARWSDAIKEAGLQPNEKQGKLSEELFLTKIAEACRHYQKFPTAMELRMFQKIDGDVPSAKAITRHFGSLKNVPSRLVDWISANRKFPDILAFVTPDVAETTDTTPPSTEGAVYLLRSGSHYKIGRSDELERRVKEIRIALPDAATLVHSIRTDDPPGIEAYWHRRFADKRANGEWFKLSVADVAAFKRRKFQ